MAPDRSVVLYGSLGLMVLETLDALGPLHDYRIARRIEQERATSIVDRFVKIAENAS